MVKIPPIANLQNVTCVLKMNVEKTSIINIGHTELFLRSDNIIQVNATDHLYSVEDIKAIHAAVNTIAGTKKALLLLVASNFTSIDPDARHYLSTPEAGAYSIAEAYVIKSLAQRILLNFLITVQGTPVPAKFFTEQETAVKWLKTFNKTN